MRKLPTPFIFGLFAILATAMAHIILRDLFPEISIPFILTLMYPLSVLVMLYGIFTSTQTPTPERVRTQEKKKF